MGLSIDVIDSTNYNSKVVEQSLEETLTVNFSEIIEQSYEKPVIVDFFATWCGPCKVLKEILDKLVQEYDFVLAKIDIDQNQDLASKYSVEGVPDVRVLSQGEMLPGFVGVLPEPQIRDLLRRLNLKSDLEVGLEAAQRAILAGNAPQAKQLFDDLFTKYPQHPVVTIKAAQFLVSVNQLEYAQRMLNTIGPDQREYFPQAQAVRASIEFKQVVDNPGEGELDQRFAQAARHIVAQNYEQGLQIFLSIVATNRQYRNDGAKKAMVSVFNLLGSEHPLTKEYQYQLMSTLY